MKKKLLLTLLGLTLCVSIFSQSQTDSIKIFKVFGGYRFESKGKILTYGEMLKSNSDANSYMIKSQTSSGFATLLGCAGGFMIGWPIGTALAGGNPNWTLAGVGCGLLVISIPILNSSNNNALIAIKKYNSNIKSMTYQNQYDLKLGLGSNELSLKFLF